MNALAFGTVLGSLLAAATAQAAPELDVSTRLHAARLREVLDLDSTGAAADYTAIAAERNHRERWIAVTRLAELQRIGVATTVPPTNDAPQAIKDALQLLTPLPWAEIVRQAGVGSQPPTPDGMTTAPLSLHPATHEALRWLRSKSGPSLNDRQRQRASATRSRADAARNDTARVDRINATDIVRRELEGKFEQAKEMRDFFFRNWRPPTTTEEPKVLMARVRSNLDAWLKEVQTIPFQTEVLTRLRDELEARAAADPQSALRLVERLPIYAERLLAESGK